MRHGSIARELMRELAAGETVSGEALAARLGVTRAAIWKQVAALRAAGVPIEASSGAGYRLPWPTQLLDRERIVAALADDDSAVAAAPVELHWELDSTQDELARRLADLPDLAVVLAEQQTLGRGRRGRGWHSPPGMGIALSCLKRFGGSPAALSGLSIAMGVSVVHALAGLGVPDLRIKWPNDVVARGGKLAGILIEISGEYDGPCIARVGVGVNVRLPAAVAASLDQPASDLASLCGGAPPDRNRLVARLIGHLRRDLLDFERSGLKPFAEAFEPLDALADAGLTVQGVQGIRSGIGRGIDERGALRVQTEAGIVTLHSGEVSVRRR